VVRRACKAVCANNAVLVRTILDWPTSTPPAHTQTRSDALDRTHTLILRRQRIPSHIPRKISTLVSLPQLQIAVSNRTWL